VHYRRALHVLRWELLASEGDGRYLQMALKQGQALRQSGHLISAEVVFKEAQAAAADRAEICLQLQTELALLRMAQGREPEALELIQTGLQQAIVAGATEAMMTMYLELAKALRTEDPERAIGELEEGLLLVTGGEGEDSEQAPQEFWKMLNFLASLHQRQGNLGRALALNRQAMLQARREGSVSGQAQSHLLMGRLLELAAEADSSAENYTIASQLFGDMGDRKNTARCLLLLARQGRKRDTAELAQQAKLLAEQIAWDTGARTARRLQGQQG
jgi:hypothetical protein